MHSCLLRIPTLTCMEGSLIERTSLRLYLAVSAPSTRVSNVREVKKCIAPGSKRTTRMQNVSFRSETPSVYLGRHWHDTCEKMDQAFPSVFTYCKQSKTGLWEGLGTRNEATQNVLAYLEFPVSWTKGQVLEELWGCEFEDFLFSPC